MKILFLDDIEARHVKFDEITQKHHVGVISHVGDVDTCISAMKSIVYDIVFLDHDLGPDETGMDVVNWMVENIHMSKRPFVVIHSANPGGVTHMQEKLRDHGYQTMAKPFYHKDFRWLVNNLLYKDK